MKIINRAITTIISVSLIACATPAADIHPISVSSVKYDRWSCDNLTRELERVTRDAALLAGRLDKAATNDKWIFTAGLLLAWPAFFALGGNEAQQQQYALLKGEHDALRAAYTLNGCNDG